MRILSKQSFKLNFGLFEFIKKENVPIRYSSDKQVRVRFAPSPTGFLHLGGLRTALYNYLFARSCNGVSLLRLEDTDQTRFMENASENLMQDLHWCGLEYDEPPVIQSKRLEIYKDHINQLVDQGDAYHCFCTKARLNLRRRQLIKDGETPKYDNKCRSLSKAEVEAKLKSGMPSCVRFKLTSFKEGYHDMVFGDFYSDVAASEGDFVIFKDDGFPTYHFANVVDDHLMGITHVLRGIEWQVSTPKHLLLYRAFGWTPPAYGHLPLLLNPDRSKLSKRVGGTEVRYFRENGFLPIAVLNFISSFGGGFNIESDEKNTNIYTLQELIQEFDVKKIRTNSCIIQMEKLDYFNKMEMKKLLETEEGQVTLTKLAKGIIQEHFKSSENLNLTDNYVRTIIVNIQDRISSLRDLIKEDFYFLWVWKQTWNETDSTIKNSVKNLASELIHFKSEWTEENIKSFFNNFMEKTKVKKPAFFKSLRLLFTGLNEGPSIVEIFVMLGRDNIQNRLSVALEENKEEIVEQ